MITTTSSRPLLPVCAPRGRPVSRRSFFISNSTGDDLSSFRAGLSQHLEQSIKTRTFAASDASAACADLIEVRLTREMPLDNIQSTPPPSCARCRPRRPRRPRSRSSRRFLPQVALEEYDSTVADLSSGGKVLVMDFYTQWCGPCKLMKPTLIEWSESMAAQGVSFRSFEASKKNAPVGKALGIKSVPTLIVRSPSSRSLWSLVSPVAGRWALTGRHISPVRSSPGIQG